MLIRLLLSLLLCSSILKAAGASMVLESRETLTIKSVTLAEYTVYQKVLINDETAKDLAWLSIETSDYVKLKSVKATVFDKNGERRGRYKKKHFGQHKFSGYGIIGNDDISYGLNLSNVTPLPFTLEIEYTKIINSLFLWPDWSPQEKIPVLLASYTLEVPPGYGFSSFSPSGIPVKKPAENTYIWSQVTLPAWPKEIALPHEVYDRYKVFFTPDTFKMNQYWGSLASWQGVADFYETLARDQYDVDPEMVSDLSLQTAVSLRDSISQIYEYVQKNTRYVGIELGVHGWKPHSSQWVCENNYGDCKDLATFFITLLRMHHIEAYPVLIRTRNLGVTYPEFPNDRFNHVIACVPLPDDTLWVDCTEDNGRIDIINELNQGCHVIVVGGAGPVLTQTPVQGPELNSIAFKGDVEISDNGAAMLRGQLELRGQASKASRSGFQNVILRDQREAILSLFSETAPGLVLDTFSIDNLDDKYAPLIISITGHIPHFATQTGQRFFVYPALPSKAGWYGEHPSRRSEPFFAGIPSLSTSEIDLHVSDTWELESIPADLALETPFGQIFQTTTRHDKLIHYSWKRSGSAMKIELEDYKDYYEYRLKAKQVQAAPLVFKLR